jgi:hypothetical protein
VAVAYQLIARCYLREPRWPTSPVVTPCRCTTRTWSGRFSNSACMVGLVAASCSGRCGEPVGGGGASGKSSWYSAASTTRALNHTSIGGNDFHSPRAPNAAARGRVIAKLNEAAPGSRERALYEEFETAKRTAEAASAFARVTDEDGGRFPLTGRGDINTYALFTELFATLTGPRGRAGVIVPTGIAINDTTSSFFGAVVAERRLLAIQAFDEIKNWFAGTKDNQSFCIFVLSNHSEFPKFVFHISNTAELKDERRIFQLSPEEIARINPNTKTAPVFRSRVDAELTARIYTRVPVLIDEAKGKDGNPWGVSLMAMFHMSNDSDLFRTGAQLREAGYFRDSCDWRARASAAPRQVLALAGGHDDRNLALPGSSQGGSFERYVPLYEAKMIHHFDHRFGFYPEGHADDTRALPRPSPSTHVSTAHF